MTVKNLGQLTTKIINNWPNKFDFKDATYYCRHCGGIIIQATCLSLSI